MGQTSSKLVEKVFSPPPDAETRKEIKGERESLYNDLKNFQKKVQQQRDAKTLTPESAEELSSVILETQEWLRKNPNANILEVKSQRDDLETKTDPIYERDRPRSVLDTFIVSMNYQLSVAIDSGKYKKDRIPIGQKTLKNELAWTTKHRKERGMVYGQRLDSLKNQLAKDLEVPKTELDAIETTINEGNPASVKKTIEENIVAKEVKDANEFNTTRLINRTFSIGIGTFAGFILFVLILFGGSLAANMAISREPIYRIFYFVYGSLPWFTPFIYLYAALLSIKGEAVKYYGVLPISTQPATTRLGKILWWPFYYETDKYESEQSAKFIDSLSEVAGKVLAVAKPPAVQL
jgi:hypothetical protein